MSNATGPEVVQGGFASSGLAKRRGLAWFQGYGLYLTDRRLVAVHVNAPRSFDWTPGAGSQLGSFGTKVTPFMDRSPLELDALERLEREFECQREHISSIELKKPGGLFLKGSVKIILLSGRTFNLGIMEESEAYGAETYRALADMLQSRLAEKLKTA